jgi:hypothetical protein
MKSAIYILLIIIAFSTGSCSGRKAKLDSNNLIPEKQLISILVDIHITDGLLSLPKINYKYTVLDSITTYYHVIEKYGYTKEAMDKTMKYYFIKNPKKLNKIYDIVLGRLSEMESRVEKQSFAEQARISNLWRGKDFYALPSVDKQDPARIDITLSNSGFYKLVFTTTVYPDDQSFNPQIFLYSVSPDSLNNGKKHFMKSIRYLKDGRPHTHVLEMNVPTNNPVHFSGSLFDANNPEWIENHYKIENISLTYSIVPL